MRSDHDAQPSLTYSTTTILCALVFAATMASAVADDRHDARGDSRCYERVFFAFDRTDLDEKARSVLAHFATCAKDLTGRIHVEGHTDERGTTTYKLHLGSRLAESAQKYLVNLGLDATRVRATSFGKERPLCTEHTETCRAMNRRVEVWVAPDEPPTSAASRPPSRAKTVATPAHGDPVQHHRA
jgi:outer membrane protein OmpA-like peptidoglycan-associated protein